MSNKLNETAWIIMCPRCGTFYPCKHRIYLIRNREGRDQNCPKCSHELSIERMKNSMLSKSKEEINDLNRRKTLWYVNMSEEEKEKHREKMSRIQSKIPRTTDHFRTHESMTKQRIAVKKFWDNLSEEEKERRTAHLQPGFRNWWDNLSDEEKEKYGNDMRQRQLNHWNSLSDEDKERHIQTLRKNSENYFNNLTDEDRIRMSRHSKQIWENKSSAERKKYSKQLSDRNYETWKSMSEEEKERRKQQSIKIFQEYYNSLSEDDYIELNRRREQQLHKNFHKPNKTEELFMDKLDINHMKYNTQWHSQIKHELFDELFPVNPYSERGRISWSHRWDFIIHCKDRDVLVDIDGSIHLLQEGDFITKEGFDVGSYIQFNDSKRPYQTDGLDAYIIQCYDDNLNNNTYVLSFQTYEIMTFEQFFVLLVPIKL